MEKNIKTFLKNYENGLYESEDVSTQIEAGWYDWFCKDRSLKNKTTKLAKKVIQISQSNKIDINNQYVWFKNNCPMDGNLYDDFRISDIKTGDVIYTIAPAVGYNHSKMEVKKGIRKGLAEVWGKENNFDKPLIIGTWKDIKVFFNI